jgi:hypothetical protein
VDPQANRIILVEPEPQSYAAPACYVFVMLKK